MSLQRFAHPRTGKVISFEWDDAQGDPTPDVFDSLVAMEDSAPAEAPPKLPTPEEQERERIRKAWDFQVNPEETHFSFKSPRTGRLLHANIPEGATSLGQADIDALMHIEEDFGGTAKDFVRSLPSDELTPPPRLGVGILQDTKIPEDIQEMLRTPSGKAGLKAGTREAAATATWPIMAAGKTAGYAGMKLGQAAAEARTGVPFKPEYVPTWETSQDPLSMATEGWRSLAEKGRAKLGVYGGEEELNIATPAGQAALMGMSPEEQDRFWQANPLLAKLELGGDTAFQLLAGLGAGGGIGKGTLALSGGTGKFARTAKALGWVVDPVNKLQFAAQEASARNIARAQELGLKELPAAVLKEQEKNAAILAKIQELQTAVAQGNQMAAFERGLGRAFLPGMAVGAVEGFDNALDENLSPRERALGLASAIQSGGFGMMALYHATRQARNPAAGDFIQDPVMRAAVEKVIAAKDPQMAEENIAELRRQFREYDATKAAKEAAAETMAPPPIVFEGDTAAAQRAAGIVPQEQLGAAPPVEAVPPVMEAGRPTEAPPIEFPPDTITSPPLPVEESPKQLKGQIDALQKKIKRVEQKGGDAGQLRGQLEELLAKRGQLKGQAPDTFALPQEGEVAPPLEFPQPKGKKPPKVVKTEVPPDAAEGIPADAIPVVEQKEVPREAPKKEVLPPERLKEAIASIDALLPKLEERLAKAKKSGDAAEVEKVRKLIVEKQRNRKMFEASLAKRETVEKPPMARAEEPLEVPGREELEFPPPEEVEARGAVEGLPLTPEETEHTAAVMGSPVGRRAMKMLNRVGEKLSIMANRFRLSKESRKQEHGRQAGFAPASARAMRKAVPKVIQGFANWGQAGGRVYSDITTMADQLRSEVIYGETMRAGRKAGEPLTEEHLDKARMNNRLLRRMFAQEIVDHLIHEMTHPLSNAEHSERLWNPEDIRLTDTGEIDAITHQQAFEEMDKAHRELLQKSGEYDELVSFVERSFTETDIHELADMGQAHLRKIRENKDRPLPEDEPLASLLPSAKEPTDESDAAIMERMRRLAAGEQSGGETVTPPPVRSEASVRREQQQKEAARFQYAKEVREAQRAAGKAEAPDIPTFNEWWERGKAKKAAAREEKRQERAKAGPIPRQRLAAQLVAKEPAPARKPWKMMTPEEKRAFIARAGEAAKETQANREGMRERARLRAEERAKAEAEKRKPRPLDPWKPDPNKPKLTLNEAKRLWAGAGKGEIPPAEEVTPPPVKQTKKGRKKERKEKTAARLAFEEAQRREIARLRENPDDPGRALTKFEIEEANREERLRTLKENLKRGAVATKVAAAPGSMELGAGEVAKPKRERVLRAPKEKKPVVSKETQKANTWTSIEAITRSEVAEKIKPILELKNKGGTPDEVKANTNKAYRKLQDLWGEYESLIHAATHEDNIFTAEEARVFKGQVRKIAIDAYNGKDVMEGFDFDKAIEIAQAQQEATLTPPPTGLEMASAKKPLEGGLRIQAEDDVDTIRRKLSQVTKLSELPPNVNVDTARDPKAAAAINRLIAVRRDQLFDEAAPKDVTFNTEEMKAKEAQRLVDAGLPVPKHLLPKRQVPKVEPSKPPVPPGTKKVRTELQSPLEKIEIPPPPSDVIVEPPKGTPEPIHPTTERTITALAKPAAIEQAKGLLKEATSKAEEHRKAAEGLTNKIDILEDALRRYKRDNPNWERISTLRAKVNGMGAEVQGLKDKLLTTLNAEREALVKVDKYDAIVKTGTSRAPKYNPDKTARRRLKTQIEKQGLPVATAISTIRRPQVHETREMKVRRAEDEALLGELAQEEVSRLEEKLKEVEDFRADISTQEGQGYRVGLEGELSWDAQELRDNPELATFSGQKGPVAQKGAVRARLMKGSPFADLGVSLEKMKAALQRKDGALYRAMLKRIQDRSMLWKEAKERQETLEAIPEEAPFDVPEVKVEEKEPGADVDEDAKLTPAERAIRDVNARAEARRKLRMERGETDPEIVTAMVGAGIGFATGGFVGAAGGALAGSMFWRAMARAAKNAKMQRMGKWPTNEEIKASRETEEHWFTEGARDLQTLWLSAATGPLDTIWRNHIQGAAQGGYLLLSDTARSFSYAMGAKAPEARDAFYRNLHRVAAIKNFKNYAKTLGDTVAKSQDAIFGGKGATKDRRLRIIERLANFATDERLNDQYNLVMSGEVEMGGGKSRRLRPAERFARVLMLGASATERAFRVSVMERYMAPLLREHGLENTAEGYAKLLKKSVRDPEVRVRVIEAMGKAESTALWRSKGLRSHAGGKIEAILRSFEKVPLLPRMLVTQFPNYFINNFMVNMAETNPIVMQLADAMDVGPARSSAKKHREYTQFLHNAAKEAAGLKQAKATYDLWMQQNRAAYQTALKAHKPGQKRAQVLIDHGVQVEALKAAEKSFKKHEADLKKEFQSGYMGKGFSDQLRMMGAFTMALGFAVGMARGKDDKDSPFDLVVSKDKDGKKIVKNIFPILAELSPMYLIGDVLAKSALGSDYYSLAKGQGVMSSKMVQEAKNIFSGTGRPMVGDVDANAVLEAFMTREKDEDWQKVTRKWAGNMGAQFGRAGIVGTAVRGIGYTPKYKTRPDISPTGEKEDWGGIPQSFKRGFTGKFSEKGLTPSYDATSGEIRKELSLTEQLKNVGMSQREVSPISDFLQKHPEVKTTFLRSITGKPEYDKGLFEDLKRNLTIPMVRKDKKDGGEKLSILEMLQDPSFPDAEKEKLLSSHLTKVVEGYETFAQREAFRKKDVMSLPPTMREKLGKFDDDRKLKRELRGELRHIPREPRSLRRMEKMGLAKEVDKLSPPPTSAPTPQPTATPTGAPSSKLVSDAAKKHNVDPNLIKAVVMVESAGQKHAVSSAGARGYMQLMPATFRAFGGKDIHNGWENVMVGTKYLKHLLDMFDGDVEKALAAYNAGPGRVRSGKPLPAETVRYVKKVMDRYQSPDATGM